MFARFYDGEGVYVGHGVLSDALLAEMIAALGLSSRDCEPGTWARADLSVTAVPLDGASLG